ncbi:hypothetical protein F5Y19DRAFT_470820 [Xylariaceae sp. FL1651]|nr:hypothetical protein F5Y19DRAFT_470820 [Xylariaceae sp. FL1651]
MEPRQTSSQQKPLLQMTHASLDPKTKKVEDTRTNLPLPEQPPVPSDWNSADARNVNVGSGRVESTTSTGGDLRDPVVDANISSVGRQGKDNLEGPPKDAAAKQ